MLRLTQQCDGAFMEQLTFGTGQESLTGLLVEGGLQKLSADTPLHHVQCIWQLLGVALHYLSHTVPTRKLTQPDHNYYEMYWIVSYVSQNIHMFATHKGNLITKLCGTDLWNESPWFQLCDWLPHYLLLNLLHPLKILQPSHLGLKVFFITQRQ